jgi:hypothetical protein
MSTIRIQRNIDPLQMNDKEKMLSHALEISTHVDIFEVPESHVDIIQQLKEKVGDKSFLVKVTLLDVKQITTLVEAGVNMISFVAASVNESFDFRQFDSVKFVADMTVVYKNSENDAVYLMAARYLKNNVFIFNLNTDSDDDISLVSPFVELQYLGAEISINVKAENPKINSTVAKIVENKVNIISLVETTPNITLYNTLSTQLKGYNKSISDLKDDIEQQEASLTVFEYVTSFMKEDKSTVIEKLQQTANSISLINNNTYLASEFEGLITKMMESESYTAQLFDKKINATKITLERLRNTRLTAISSAQTVDEQLDILTPKIEKYQTSWYGKEYRNRVNKGQVYKTLVDIKECLYSSKS